jgi:branched-chain amino acid transport system substrate-binding protein
VNKVRLAIVAGLSAVIVVLLAVSGCQSQQAQSAALIAMTAPMSGADEAVGNSVLGAVQLAIDDRNAHGGAAGYNVAIKALDDGDDPEQASSVAQVIIPDTDVIAVLGGFDNAAAQVAVANYGNAHLAFLTLSGIEVIRWSSTHPVYRMVAKDSDAGRLAGQFATGKLSSRRVVILSESPAGEDPLGDAFGAAAQEGGASVVLHLSVERDETDFADTIRQVSSASPDLIFFAGRAVEAGEFLKQARAAGVTAVFMGGPAVDDARLLQNAGSAAQGAYYVSTGYPLARVNDANLRNRLTAAVGGQESRYTALAYDAANVLLDAVARAVKAAHYPSRPSVAAALRTTKLSGVTGEISFDEQGNRRNPPLGIYQIQGNSYPGTQVQ